MGTNVHIPPPECPAIGERIALCGHGLSAPSHTYQATAPVAGPSGASTPPIRAQVAFWNAEVVAVPLGVMVGTRALVVLGSIALLTALDARVLVGTVLAWDIPWL
jgi:hypothetical protein